jgi:acetyl esterase/lipase
MTHALDPQLLQEITAALTSGAMTLPQAAARDDWKTLRASGEAALAAIEAALPERPEVSRSAYTATSHDGAPVALRWYAPQGHDSSDSAHPGGRPPEPPGKGPAAIYLHGGGMITGSVQLYDRWIAAYVADGGVPMLAVEYRRAPEHPHPSPAEDSYAGLAWLAVHAGELGIDPGRIALMGDSGGGGLAAAAALLARDRGLAVAKQILIYPMLDDRTTVPDPALVPFAGWSYDDNYTGWHALLGENIGTNGVPASAAPARAVDLAGLPPAYMEVGELDIFRNEDIEYARRVAAAGTSVELHVHPGCPHGFDRAARGADVVRRSRADRLRALRSY